jgi:hypothetical protein
VGNWQKRWSIKPFKQGHKKSERLLDKP